MNIKNETQEEECDVGQTTDDLQSPLRVPPCTFFPALNVECRKLITHLVDLHFSVRDFVQFIAKTFGCGQLCK